MEIVLPAWIGDMDSVMHRGGAQTLGAFLILLSRAAMQDRTDGVLPLDDLRWCGRDETIRPRLEKHGFAAFDDEAETITLLGRGEFWGLRDSHVSAAVRKAVIERDGACVYCGSTDALAADHIKPRSQGGSTGMDNLAAACRRCNTDKGNRTPEQWRAGIQVPKGFPRNYVRHFRNKNLKRAA